MAVIDEIPPHAMDRTLGANVPFHDDDATRRKIERSARQIIARFRSRWQDWTIRLPILLAVDSVLA